MILFALSILLPENITHPKEVNLDEDKGSIITLCKLTAHYNLLQLWQKGSSVAFYNYMIYKVWLNQDKQLKLNYQQTEALWLATL